MPLRYTIVRLLLRVWFGLVYGKVRLLGASDEVAASGAALLVVGHPARLLDVLLLVASLDRQLHLLVDPAIVSGPARRFLAQTLGMITDSVDGPERDCAGIRACRELLECEEAVVVFTHAAGEMGNPQPRLDALARMALEVEASPASALDIAMLSVHLLAPFAPLGETLIHFGEPIFPHDLVPSRDEPLEQRTAELSASLNQACAANPFALRRDDVDHLLNDLTDVLRSDLAAEWASRSDWKQTVEGFTLSRFVVEWVEHANRVDPHKLVTLREALDVHREARRSDWQRSFEMESAVWTQSIVRRLLTLLESALGLPVASYGLINHLPAGLLIFLTGLWGRLKKRTTPSVWAAAVAILLSSYAGAIVLVNHRFGRSAAGYYAVTLPLSGTYLWRYVWLWRHRTRLLLQDLFASRNALRLRRMRKQLLAQVAAARDAHADTLGLAH